MRIATLFVLLFACSCVSAINYTITAPATPILEGNSTDQVYTFTITRSDTTDAVDIGVNIVTLTASAGDLTTFTNQTASFLATEATTTFTVTITADTIFETSETFNITLTVGPSDTFTPLTVSIINDDAAPIITISAGLPTPEGNGTIIGSTFIPAQKNVTITFTLVGATEVNCGFTWATQAVTALVGLDFLSRSNTKVIPVGQTSTTDYVTILGDISYEAAEYFAVGLQGSGCSAPAPGAVFIANDDPLPFLSIAQNAQVIEGTGTISYLNWLMTITPPAGVNIVVSFALNAGSSNVTPTDYTLPTGNVVVVPPGASQSNLWVRVNGDQLKEYNETISLDLTGFVNATYVSGYTTLYGLIVDDDPYPSLSVVDTSFLEGSANNNKTVVISTGLGWTQYPMVVTWALNDGTALSGSDYLALVGQTTVTAGSGNAIVTLVGDAVPEFSNETFTLSILNVTCGACPWNASMYITKPTGVITIMDDDEPYLYISGTSATEGSTTYIVFTVSIQAVQAADITFDYVTLGGTAIAGQDFVAISGSATLTAGKTSISFNVSLIDDTISEPTETVIFNVTGITSGPARVYGAGYGYILDNAADPIPTLYTYNVTVIEGDNGTTLGYVPLSLSFATQRTVNVTYSTKDESAYSPVDYLTTDGWVAFTPGQTSQNITVYIVGDQIEELETAFVVRLVSVTNANFGNYTAGVIISDDDYLITAAVQSDVYEGSPSFNPRFISLIIVIGVVLIAIIASIVGFFALKRYVS